MSDNLPCPKQVGAAKGKCDGELILIDGSSSRVRLKCNKCGIVVTLKISLIQFSTQTHNYKKPQPAEDDNKKDPRGKKKGRKRP